MLKKLSKEQKLYNTASLNDKLYLHQQGFRRLDPEVLKEFTGIKMLWLQANGLEKLEGFEHMPLLRNIAAHENCIEKIEGLEHSKELDSINLNRNFIKKVEGFEKNQNLTSINLGNNAIGPDGESYKAVAENLPKLQTLDLQANKIEDGAELLKILQKIPDLRVFYGMGNPFVKSFRHYRKRFVAGLPSLRYLDDRPVFEDERKRCEAWFAAFGPEEDLDAANACLVIFTDSYRACFDEGRTSALCKEAKAILRRARRDPNFKLFVLDPSIVGQDYANLKLYLDLDVQSMNVELWQTFMARGSRAHHLVGTRFWWS